MSKWCTLHRKQHQLNRRTELKILGLMKEDPLMKKTLAEIIFEENFDEKLKELEAEGTLFVPEGEELPEELEKSIGKEEEKDTPPGRF